ncbi:hypothetical protein DFH09DRAFT_157157 [Mycena vulgaris]|nr:hypothetical protein DFH09DRAFT_157157 [Mycena vulgaris]
MIPPPMSDGATAYGLVDPAKRCVSLLLLRPTHCWGPYPVESLCGQRNTTTRGLYVCTRDIANPMNHPYSGAANYIYVNEYASTPVQPPRSFASGQYTESLSSEPSTSSPITAAHQPSTRRSGRLGARPQSQEPLLHVSQSSAHPYTTADSLKEEEDADAEPSMRTAPLAPNRAAKPSTRRLTFTAYDPMRVMQREREGAREDERRMGLRRKIQKRIRRALRRLKRFLEAL